MTDPTPARHDSESLADVVEMLLDKGVVINADIAVAVGDTELLAIQIRAALASFETAAEYGLQFPDGTDMQRVAEASDRSSITDRDATPGMADDATTGGDTPAVTAAGAGDDEDESEAQVADGHDGSNESDGSDLPDETAEGDEGGAPSEGDEAEAAAASTEGDEADAAAASTEGDDGDG